MAFDDYLKATAGYSAGLVMARVGAVVFIAYPVELRFVLYAVKQSFVRAYGARVVFVQLSSMAYRYLTQVREGRVCWNGRRGAEPTGRKAKSACIRGDDSD